MQQKYNVFYLDQKIGQYETMDLAIEEIKKDREKNPNKESNHYKIGIETS